MDRFPFNRQMTITRSTLANSDCGSPIRTKIDPKTSKSATATPSSVKLNHSEFDDFHSKVLKIQKYFENLRNQIVDSASSLIQQINKQSKLALNNLIEYEFEILTLQNSAKRGKSIKHEKISKILRFFIPTQVEKLHTEEVSKEIQKLYDLKVEDLSKPALKRSAYELICAKDYISGLISIDLSTFQVNPIKFAPKVYTYSTVIPITNKKIFINGGYTGSASVTDTFIVDLDKRSYERIPSTVRRDAAGIVMKENKVFVFGGIEKRESSLEICECFDLETSRWSQLPKLPYASCANTATLVENRIFLLGLQCDNLLEYDDLNGEFRNIIPVPKDCMKFVFENWVITPEEIMEFDVADIRWKRYCFPAKLNFGWLFSFSCARVEKYFYFIDDVNGLLRLDTEQKKIDKIV